MRVDKFDRTILVVFRETVMPATTSECKDMMIIMSRFAKDIEGQLSVRFSIIL